MKLADILDRLRPCREELLRERVEMWLLHDEHHDLATRVVRQAVQTRDALVGVTILLTVEEVDRLFAQDRAGERRRSRPDREAPAR